MVWTQDRLHDRQRVVHWDLSGGPGGPARRLVDMYSAGEQRVYEPRDRGRLLLSPSAFHDGNFSLLIRAVEEGDEGLYTCNLHHHYCHLYESLAVRLEVTDDPQAARAYWDGEKEVLAAVRGAPALLTCVNRAHVWTDRHLEEAQQVAHWDRQPPGVPHDRADRLLDLYASGERRAYGPPFLRDRVAVGADAFARGDFSLSIDPLEPADEGTYSCHLHHHYCGLHERRVFHLRVTEPAAEPPPRASPGNGSGHGSVPGPGEGAPPRGGAAVFLPGCLCLTPPSGPQTPRWREAAASSTSSSPRAGPTSSSNWATCWPRSCSSSSCSSLWSWPHASAAAEAMSTRTRSRQRPQGRM
ncbi:matrix-remodeling-associated protein 8 [Marmota monax]|uniref:Matrix remodeling-associated protein 8 n=1 Tax=Marmota monax TaxID=9995 RepID=A0A834PRW6_MARMO|nr:matrix-remodeling-associated protein 8 [Marmota monax]